MLVHASSKDVFFSTEYTSQTEAGYDHTANRHNTFATLRECGRHPQARVSVNYTTSHAGHPVCLHPLCVWWRVPECKDMINITWHLFKLEENKAICVRNKCEPWWYLNASSSLMIVVLRHIREETLPFPNLIVDLSDPVEMIRLLTLWGKRDANISACGKTVRMESILPSSQENVAIRPRKN